MKVWLCCVRFVTVMVRSVGALAELTMPKSSSFGEKTTATVATPAAGAGRACVCEFPLEAEAVMLPGPVPLSAMLHSPPAGSVAAQFVDDVNPLTATCRPVASAEPRLRSVRFGESPTESASDAVAAAAFAGIVSFARYAAEPVHRLPLQADAGSTAFSTVEGSAVVGALCSGRSKVGVVSRLWLPEGVKLPPASASPPASTAILVSVTGALALVGVDAGIPPKRALHTGDGELAE